MTALSSADKMKLRVSAARVERIKREALKPANNPVDKDGNMKQVRMRLKLCLGQVKPQESLGPDLMDGLYRLSDGGTFRSMSGKLGTHSNAIAARMHSQSKLVDGIEVFQTIYHPEDGIGPDSPIGASEKAVKAGIVRAYVPACQAPSESKTSCHKAGSPFKRHRSMPLVIVKGKL